MKLLDLVNTRGIALLDGGLATELERRGHDLDDPLWSARVLLERPDAIVAVHRDYLDAGADIVTTASYQATFAGLARRGLPHDAAAELIEASVRLARRACEESNRPDAIVAGSIGPYGAFLADGSEYRGDYGLSVDTLVDFHGPRLDVLAASCDVIACETIPCLAEAQALARLLPGIDAWVSFSCRDAHHVSHGEPLRECIEAVACATAVGVNCISPTLAENLLRTAASVTDKPLVVYPNSGEAWEGRMPGWSGCAVRPDELAAAAPAWVAAGARIVGGCCRTTPAHTRALARWRDAAGRNMA